MAEPYLAGIIMFAGNFAPRSYALCQGQILSIAQNTALFSLLGTTYGGNGQTTFALPDLRSRVPVGQGQGPGLSSYVLGEQDGVESVTLTINTMPSHNHLVNANGTDANPGAVKSPIGNFPGYNDAGPLYAPTSTGQMNPGMAGNNGGSQPHENRQPLLCLNFIIAIQGLFPSRN